MAEEFARPVKRRNVFWETWKSRPVLSHIIHWRFGDLWIKAWHCSPRVVNNMLVQTTLQVLVALAGSVCNRSRPPERVAIYRWWRADKFILHFATEQLLEFGVFMVWVSKGALLLQAGSPQWCFPHQGGVNLPYHHLDIRFKLGMPSYSIGLCDLGELMDESIRLHTMGKVTLSGFLSFLFYWLRSMSESSHGPFLACLFNNGIL